MRFALSPPGITMLLVAVGEAVIAVISQLKDPVGVPVHDASQFWAQLVTAGVILAVGTWAIRDHLALRREIEKAKDEVDEKQATRHEENKHTIAELRFMLMGIQGKGGLMEDRQRNQERRHDMAQEITIIYAILREQAVFLTKVGERLKEPFYPMPIDRPHRRRGDGHDG